MSQLRVGLALVFGFWMDWMLQLQRPQAPKGRQHARESRTASDFIGGKEFPRGPSSIRDLRGAARVKTIGTCRDGFRRKGRPAASLLARRTI